MKEGLKCISHLEDDEVFIALVIHMLMFSIMDHRYNPYERILVEDIRSAVKIENKKIDLLWPYMNDRYGTRRAVVSFSHLIRSWLALHESLANEKDDIHN